MISEHVSEENIQLYVLDSTQLPLPVKHHLEQCAECMSAVKQYEALFTGIGSLDKPSFDFDVVELVLPQLQAKKRTSWYRIPVIILSILAGTMLLGLPFFLFKLNKSGYRITGLWNDLSPWMIAIVLFVVIGLIVVSVAESYNRYRHQLDKLNFK